MHSLFRIHGNEIICEAVQYHIPHGSPELDAPTWMHLSSLWQSVQSQIQSQFPFKRSHSHSDNFWLKSISDRSNVPSHLLTKHQIEQNEELRESMRYIFAKPQKLPLQVGIIKVYQCMGEACTQCRTMRNDIGGWVEWVGMQLWV